MSDLRMPSTNMLILAGRLTRDPELKYTNSGRAYCRLSLANEERWKSREGEQQKRTLYIDATVWDKLAEYIGEKLRKGRPVEITGKLVMDEWDDRETGKKRRAIKIQANNVQILDWGESERRPKEDAHDDAPDMGQVDDIPF